MAVPVVPGHPSTRQACRVLVFDNAAERDCHRSLGYGSLEERTDDIRAVMDAAGSQRARDLRNL